MGLIKYIKRLCSDELDETLSFKYDSKYTKKRNPNLSFKRVNPLDDPVNQRGMVIKNGKRKLYVRTFDNPVSDKFVKKTGIHRDYKGNYILNVKNADTKDYTKLTAIIDKALGIK